ncbi:MAG: hypothetical protein HeimC2_46150 [Candidatus Heimdallarchaeota archaeon LC_2]|nr:MAG: hypothetical protein HeimC2_46150 [Candidatus Heimdallarchaeota archaeon LC_2]
MKFHEATQNKNIILVPFYHPSAEEVLRYLHEELEKHRYIHFKEKCFQCIFCLEEYTNPDLLSEHNCNRLGDKCSVCSMATVKFNLSIVHMKNCERKKIKP